MGIKSPGKEELGDILIPPDPRPHLFILLTWLLVYSPPFINQLLHLFFLSPSHKPDGPGPQLSITSLRLISYRLRPTLTLKIVKIYEDKGPHYEKYISNNKKKKYYIQNFF